MCDFQMAAHFLQQILHRTNLCYIDELLIDHRQVDNLVERGNIPKNRAKNSSKRTCPVSLRAVQHD